MSKLLILVMLLFSAPAFSYQESEGIDSDYQGHYVVNVSDFALPSETIESNDCCTVTGEITQNRALTSDSKIAQTSYKRHSLPNEVGWRLNT